MQLITVRHDRSTNSAQKGNPTLFRVSDNQPSLNMIGPPVSLFVHIHIRLALSADDVLRSSRRLRYLARSVSASVGLVKACTTAHCRDMPMDGMVPGKISGI